MSTESAESEDRRTEVRIPRDPEARRRLANFAGLTDEERAAIDQWCYDEEQRQRQAGVPSRWAPANPPSCLTRMVGCDCCECRDSWVVS